MSDRLARTGRLYRWAFVVASLAPTAFPGPAPAEELRLVSRQGHAGQITSVTLSLDGTLALTAATDKQAILWDLATGRPLLHILARAGFADATLSPDNNLIAVADGRDAFFHDTRTGQLVGRLAHHKEPLTAVRFAACGKRLLTASDDGTAALWELPLGEKPTPLRVLPGPGDRPLSRVDMDRAAARVLTYHSVIRKRLPGGVLIPETSAILWDAKTGKKLLELKEDKKLIGAYLSPDGATVVTTHAFGRVRVWNSEGNKLDEFDPPKAKEATLVAHVGFGVAHRVLVAWGNDNHVVRDTRAKRTVWKFSPRRSPDSLMRPAITPDGKTVALWNEPDLEFHDVETSELLHTLFFGFKNRVNVLAVSEDSKKVIAGLADGNAAVLEARRERSLVPLVSTTSPYKALAVTARGVRAMTQERDGGLDATIPAFLDWRWEGPVVKQSLWDDELQLPTAITRFALMDPAGGRLLTASFGNEVILWELPSCKARPIKGSSDQEKWVTSLAFGPGGAFAAGSDGEAFVYNPGSKSAVHLRPIAGAVGLVAFSADGRFVFTRSDTADGGKPDIEEAIWNAATGKRLNHTPARRARRERPFAPIPAPVAPKEVDTDDLFRAKVEPREAPSPVAPKEVDTGRDPVWDEGGTEELVVTNRSGPNRLLPDGRRPRDILRDARTKRFLALYPCWASAHGWDAPAVSPGGKVVATVRDRTVILWDAAKKSFCRRCEPSQAAINAIAFRRDGKALIGACRDSLRAWDVGTGRELAAFSVLDRYVHWVQRAARGGADVGVAFGPQRVDSWLVATRSGRFDTGGIDEGGPTSWVFGDQPFRALPPELFIRDYFEPRLLVKVLGGEPLPPIRPPVELNRAQPRVVVTAVTDGSRLGTVDVTVTVDPVEGQVVRDGRPVQTKAVHDLRLYRDGQLVAQEPPPKTETANLAAWEAATRLRPRRDVVEEDAGGRMVITFRDVVLPSLPAERVAFTAYAFNADRVKSATSRPRTFYVSPAVPARKGRAYVICVGVGAKDQAETDEQFKWLHFTPHNAERVRKELQAALEQGKAYEKVTTVMLVSNDRVEDRTAIRPTKGNIRTVLGLLAGRRDKEGLEKIPQSLRDSMLKDVERATPDDLVVFFFSGHGYSHPGGDFYLFPYDSGENPGPDVRADVLKRCISGQELAHWLRPIDAGETCLVIDACNSGAVSPVKPAPLGDRGLGQLAYDKAMPALAAVQAASQAKGEGALEGYSLLTYTLAVEGLHQGKGLTAGQLRMSGLLEFVAGRTPAVWKEKVKQEFNQGQLPVLLDFSGRKPRRAAAE